MKELDAIIISDLHLGSDNCQAKRLRKFFSQFGKTIKTKKLIINGDAFDSWNFKRLNKKSHWKILGDIRKLSKKIEVIWVEGNHDGPAENISHLIGAHVYKEYSFSSNDVNILVLHGHIFDDFISDHPFVTAVADLFYIIFQKIGKRFARFIKRASKSYLRNAEKVKQRAIAYAKKHHFDIVCVGHTHHEETTDDYKNSGCWTESVCSYLEVENGNITLKHFEEED